MYGIVRKATSDPPQTLCKLPVHALSMYARVRKQKHISGTVCKATFDLPPMLCKLPVHAYCKCTRV